MAVFDSLSGKKKKFVMACLTNHTVSLAAQEAGISERTAYRYLKEPVVRQALSEVMDDELTRAVGVAVGGMCSSLATLESIHRDNRLAPGARVAAARAILDNATKLREEQDIARRIVELENLLSGGQAGE